MESSIQLKVLYPCAESKADWTCVIKLAEWNYNNGYCAPEINSLYVVKYALFFYILLIHLKFSMCLCRLSWIHNDITWLIRAHCNCKGMPLQLGETDFIKLLRRLVLTIINDNNTDREIAHHHILQLGLRRWDVLESRSELGWGSPADWLRRSAPVSGGRDWSSGCIFRAVGDRADLWRARIVLNLLLILERDWHTTTVQLNLHGNSIISNSTGFGHCLSRV